MVTDKMIEAARAAYSTATGSNDTPHALDGWIEGALRAALEAALSASDAEPAAWRYGYKDGEVVAWIGVEFFNPARGENIVTEPLYADPPAVAVKALEWKQNRHDADTWEARPTVGRYDITLIWNKWELTRNTGVELGSFESPEAAKAAAQADYEARIRTALVSPADTSPVFTVAQIVEKIKDYGQDSLPKSEYRLACDDLVEAFEALAAAPVNTSQEPVNETPKSEHVTPEGWRFRTGQLVRKKSGSWWEGRVVGWYSTAQTPCGYCVQLDKPNGPVQIYPESAMEAAAQKEASHDD